LTTLSEKTPRVKIPRDRRGSVFWENEVNLGYFSKNAPVNLNLTVKQADSREDITLGYARIRSDDYLDPL